MCCIPTTRRKSLTTGGTTASRQGNGRITEAEFIEDNGEIIFTKISTTAGLFLSNQEEVVNTENLNLGVNLKFTTATDNLSVNFDASISDTEAPLPLRVR